MRKTKKLTLSAMLVAMGVVIMAVGSVTEILDLSTSVLASMLVAFACIEIGAPYNYLVWLATTALSAILYPYSLAWMSYFFAFGLWPIIKGYVERAPRPLWLFLKAIFSLLAIAAVVVTVKLVTGIPLVVTENKWVEAAMYALIFVCFFLYDAAMSAFIRFYLIKLRHRFKNLLK